MLRKTFIIPVALTFCAMQAQAQFPGFRFEEKPSDPSAIYTISVGNVTMTIDSEKGGKIKSYKFGEKEIISQSRFPNSFGSTFWTSPQKEWNWPPVPEHDSKAYTVEQKDGHIIMTGQVPERLPLRIIKDFSTDKSDNSIVVSYTLVNESDTVRSVAPWEITRVAANGTVFFDSPVEGIWPSDLMNFKAEQGVAWYTIDQADQNRKVNADGQGWLAFANDSLLMIKKFQNIDPKQPAPEEAEIQVYVNRGKSYVELESQGAYTTLQPKESFTWTVRWFLVEKNPQATSAELLDLVKKTADIK